MSVAVKKKSRIADPAAVAVPIEDALTAARVAAASKGLVVVEGAVRDRGHAASIEQGPRRGLADDFLGRWCRRWRWNRQWPGCP